MNDFASALSTALHEEAKEIGMSSDLQQAQRQLEQSMRSSDQRRRVWVAVAAAAAVVLVVAGVYAGAASRDQSPCKFIDDYADQNHAADDCELDVLVLRMNQVDRVAESDHHG